MDDLCPLSLSGPLPNERAVVVVSGVLVSATRQCSAPGCGEPTRRSGRCAACRRRAEHGRGSAASRGYDADWAKIRYAFLLANAWCVDCGERATEADHDPVSRRDLVAVGVPNPDAWERLRPRCKPCHSARTVRTLEGWGATP